MEESLAVQVAGLGVRKIDGVVRFSLGNESGVMSMMKGEMRVKMRSLNGLLQVDPQGEGPEESFDIPLKNASPKMDLRSLVTPHEARSSLDFDFLRVGSEYANEADS